jgi:hypothetical protein
MNRVIALIVFASVALSAIGCVVRTYPEHAHYRHPAPPPHHHHHEEHREVIVVHHD